MKGAQAQQAAGVAFVDGRAIRGGDVKAVDVLDRLADVERALLGIEGAEFENTYEYSDGNVDAGGSWNNPTAVYTPVFVRLNFTVNF